MGSQQAARGLCDSLTREAEVWPRLAAGDSRLLLSMEAARGIRLASLSRFFVGDDLAVGGGAVLGAEPEQGLEGSRPNPPPVWRHRSGWSSALGLGGPVAGRPMPVGQSWKLVKPKRSGTVIDGAIALAMAVSTLIASEPQAILVE
jgi:hypothetical protein